MMIGFDMLVCGFDGSVALTFKKRNQLCSTFLKLMLSHA